MKAPLYARAAILEYWLIDLPDKQLIVHREPKDGLYRDVRRFRSDEQIAPLTAPEARFCLDRL